MKKILALLTVVLMAFSFTACGSAYKSEASNSEYMEGGADTESPQMEDKSELPGAAKPAENRKLIKNFDVTIQTLEFDKSVEALEKMVEDAGGYIEMSSHDGRGAVDYGSVYSRNAEYQLRIPADKAQDTVDAFSQIGAVTSSSQSVDDVTEYYYDTDAHILSLKTQETRLLELLAQADTVDTMLTIEGRLAEVRYEIESLQGTINRLDEDIAYSRVSVYLHEVFTPEEIEKSPKTLGERIAARFRRSLDSIVYSAQDFIVFIIGDILIIGIWAIVIFAIVKLYKKVFKKLWEKHKSSKCDEINK